MVKWEYLRLRGDHEAISVREAQRQELAQYLQNVLGSAANIKIRQARIEFGGLHSSSQLLDTLGDLGWELAGTRTTASGEPDLVFKRPIEE